MESKTENSYRMVHDGLDTWRAYFKIDLYMVMLIQLGPTFNCGLPISYFF